MKKFRVLVIAFLAIAVMFAIAPKSVQAQGGGQSGWAECNGWEDPSYKPANCRLRALLYKGYPPQGMGTDMDWYAWGGMTPKPLSRGTCCGLAPSMCYTLPPTPPFPPSPTPTVDPTIEPTKTPEPTDTPTPEPTSTPEPTQTATPSPTPTASPTPSPTPTVEPTVEPTPEPTSTPEPTETPMPTLTSTPVPQWQPSWPACDAKPSDVHPSYYNDWVYRCGNPSTPEPVRVVFDTGIPLSSDASKANLTGGMLEIPELGISLPVYGYEAQANERINPIAGHAAQVGSALAVHTGDLNYANIDGVTVKLNGRIYQAERVLNQRYALVSTDFFGIVTCWPNAGGNWGYALIPQ